MIIVNNRLIIAGNWKMNTGIEEGVKLAEEINQYLSKYINKKHDINYSKIQRKIQILY